MTRTRTIPSDRKWGHFAGWCWAACDAAREQQEADSNG